MEVENAIATNQTHRSITVEGTLLVGQDSRLTANADDPTAPVVLLPHDIVKKSLLAVVPPYGGGPHIYHERASVSGTLEMNPWRFTLVKRIVIFREEVWTFELGEPT